MMLKRTCHIGRVLTKFRQSPIAFRPSILYQPRAHNSRISELTRAMDLASLQPAALSSLEEKLLNLMTPNEDDALLNVLNPEVYRAFDYESLCQLLIKMAQIGRRNTPLIKAAAMSLCKLSLKDEKISGSPSRMIVATIDALSKLNFPNSTLLSKLMWDLNETMDYDDLGPKLTCRFIRALVHLRWRNDDLMDKLTDHIYKRGHQVDFDYGIITSFFHLCAHLNLEPRKNLSEIRKEFLKGEREIYISTNPREYLNYVWCLAALKIAEASDIEMVLQKDFYVKLQSKLNFVDIMKLLNIRALSRLEYKLCEDDKHLDILARTELRKSSTLKRLSENVEVALKNFTNTSRDLRCDVITPFGFVIDFELLLDDDGNPQPLPDNNELVTFFEKAHVPKQNSRNLHKCALILTPYEGVILNSATDVVGHERMVSQILQPLGYKTIYITEVQLNRQKSSADLVNFVKIRLIEIPGQKSANHQLPQKTTESSTVSS